MDFQHDDFAFGIALGGIMGFVEESIKEEESFEDFKFTQENIEIDKVTDEDLKRFYYRNPDLFIYLVNKALEFRKSAKINREYKTVMKEIESEIDDMRKEIGNDS
jgi:CRISPR/Cas system CMR subunit Cmr4 (Cas7 group RAMP superfamily)